MYRTGAKWPWQMQWNSTYRNTVVSASAGTFFFSGWWSMVDLLVNYGKIIRGKEFIYHLPILTSTLALILINMIPFELLHGGGGWQGSNGCCTAGCARLVLFFGLMCSFGALIGSAFVMVNDFILEESLPNWPGIAIFLSNSTVLISSMLLRFVMVPRDNF